MTPEELKQLLEQIKSLGGTVDKRFDALLADLKKQTEELAALKKAADRVGTPPAEGKTLAEKCVELEGGLKALRDSLEQYTRQFPAVRGVSTVDPEYRGFWPSAEKARLFGLYCLAGMHRDPEVRRSCADEVAKANLTFRRSNGQFAKSEDYIKAMGEGTGEAGGYLVPDEFMASLIRHVSEYGVARRNLTIVPMTRETQTWPKRTGGFTVYYPDEGSAPTDSSLTFGTVKLQAKKWAILSYFSEELEEDAAIGLGELLALEFALALATAEDTNAFIGDGTSTYAGITGILSSANVGVVTAASTHTAFSTVTIDDIISLIAGVPDWVRRAPGTKFYMHPSIKHLFMKLKAETTNIPLLVDAERGGMSRLLGWEVEEVNVMPDTTDTGTHVKFVAFGNMRLWGFLGQRRGLTIRRSTEVRFTQGQITVMVCPRQDIAEADGNAMAVLRTNNA